MTDWFTSDPHFDHSSIVRLAKRPFACVNEMNEALIHNYNTLVKPRDRLFILGDFCWGSLDRVEYWRKQIKCKNIIFIIGNHDEAIDKAYSKNQHALTHLFKEIHYLKTFRINGEKLALCHYPFLEWDGFFRGSWHLFGHVHGNLSPLPGHLACDVGVDVHGYKPISFEQVKMLMELRKKFNAKNDKEYVKET